MTRPPRFAFGLLLLALAGCATAPDAPPPVVPLPPSLGAAGPARWPDADWWNGFGSPELAGLIAQAQAGNTDIAVAAAHVEQARASLRIARAPLLPAVTVSADAMQQGANASSGAVSGAFAYAEIGASWEADLWGRLRAQARSARASLAASRFDAQAVQLAVAAQVAQAWLTVVALREDRVLTEQDQASAQGLLDQTEARLRAGKALPGDVAAARVLLLQTSARIAALDRAQTQALAGLATLAGRPAQGFVVTTSSLDGIDPPTPASPGLPAELLERRPDVASAQAALAASGADVAAARAAMLPRITLSATGGGQVGAGPSEALYTLLAGLSQPIFDHGALAGQRDLAVGLRREREASYRQAVLAALGDVERSLKAADQLQREASLDAAACDQASRALAETRARHAAGEEEWVAVLQAERVLFAARTSLADARAERLRNAVALYEALGGGWRRVPPQAPAPLLR